MTRKIKTRKTPEQRQAAMQELHDSIATQVEALRDSDAWRDMLDAMSRFHNYSLGNLLLILSQRPDATRVAGYGAWRKTHGRQVRKGERGIKIIGGGTVKTTEVNPRTGEEEETRKTRFFPVTVFDISQTDPIDGEVKDVPELAQKLTGDDHNGITEAVTDWLTAQGWTVRIEPITGDANGYTNPNSKTVVIDSAMAPAQIAKTALHEAAHVVLHADEDPAEYVAHRGTKETEAESTAYVVAGLLGVDTSDYSIGYVAGWSNAETDVIKATAANVKRATTVILDAITTAPADTEQLDAELAA